VTAPLATVDDSAAGGPLARLWLFLKSRLRPAAVATPAALRVFLEERAALIAQKCAIDYCRGKTGLASYALFTEKPFLDALDVCRWETYAAALGDLMLIAEGKLRAQLSPGQHARLCEALVALYSGSLEAMPAPVHRTQGWSDAVESFAASVKTASSKAPRQALDVADHSAKRLFETLPIHASYRELDEEVVYGAVRFRMVAVSQEMQRRFVSAELAAHLVADQNSTL
jgi:hypothetical protein